LITRAEGERRLFDEIRYFFFITNDQESTLSEVFNETPLTAVALIGVQPTSPASRRDASRAARTSSVRTSPSTSSGLMVLAGPWRARCV
jgi:hypothetical protein